MHTERHATLPPVTACIPFSHACSKLIAGSTRPADPGASSCPGPGGSCPLAVLAETAYGFHDSQPQQQQQLQAAHAPVAPMHQHGSNSWNNQRGSSTAPAGADVRRQSSATAPLQAPGGYASAGVAGRGVNAGHQGELLTSRQMQVGVGPHAVHAHGQRSDAGNIAGFQPSEGPKGSPTPCPAPTKRRPDSLGALLSKVIRPCDVHLLPALLLGLTTGMGLASASPRALQQPLPPQPLPPQPPLQPRLPLPDVQPLEQAANEGRTECSKAKPPCEAVNGDQAQRLTPEDTRMYRRAAFARYKEKRATRKDGLNIKVRYAARKRQANSRARIKGRFAPRSQAPPSPLAAPPSPLAAPPDCLTTTALQVPV